MTIASLTDRTYAVGMTHWLDKRIGRDVHHLGSSGDGVACEPTPVPGDQYVRRRVT